MFPLQVNLHYQYNYHRSYIGYEVTTLVETQIDTGKVDFIIRDSVNIGDTSIVWQIDRITRLWHKYICYSNHNLDTQLTQNDTIRFTITESLSYRHRITLPWEIIFSEGSLIYCYSPWSGFTIDRYSSQDTLNQSTGDPLFFNYDSLQYIQTRGLVYRELLRNYSGISRTYDSLYVEQRIPPTVGVTRNIQTPYNLHLWQNYPNPFNPSTTIKYDIPSKAYVNIKVYNMLGQEIANLVDDILPAGGHSVVFNASNFSSGIYFYRIHAANNTITRKLVLLK
jgi:hypothetical protein